MSPEAHARLVDLDAITRQSRDFYDYAAAVLPASTLRGRCQRLAHAKAELVALLALRLPQAAVPLPRPPPPLRARVEQSLRRARASLSTPHPGQLWDELRRLESAITEDCRLHATGSGDADCRRELAWLLPLCERCRDEFVPERDLAQSV
jgi:hypothetical protein